MLINLELFFFFLSLVSAAYNYSNCYANCNSCDTTDFTKCTATSYPCMFGYMYDSKTTSCIVMPGYNVIIYFKLLDIYPIVFKD